MYGTYENMRNDVVRAAAYSVVSATPDATPMQFVHDTVAEIARHPQRTNQAEIEIQSFHPDELSADDPFDIQLAHLAGLELARRLAPNTDVVVATHTDSKSGHLHNHIIYANHDRVTGTTPRNVRNFHKVKHINDEVMKDLGLEVYAPEVPPGPGGGLSVLRGKALPEITKDNWREEMTQRVDAVLADPRVAAASTVSDGLEVAQNIASEYNVSFRVTTHEKENRDDVTATSYALVDDDGEMIRYSTSRGSRSTERTGSRLGRDAYTYEVVNQRIEDLQRQYQQQLNQQQQIRTLQELNHAEEAQEEHSEPEPTTVQAGGTFGIGGTESLTDKYADILTDAGTTADTGAEPAAAAPGAAEEEERTDAVHGDGTRRTVHAVGEGRDGGSPRPDERSLPGRREREHQAAVSSSGSVVQPESARQDAAAEPTTSGRSQAAPWSPDDSVEDMRQVDLDFLEQRVMNDEFRQFQRSEFAGTDAEYFAHLLDDDSAVAEDHENYAHARTRLFNPVGDRREYFLRSVGENRRRAAAIQRQRQQRQNQQQRQKYAPDF
ncbi:hypothetical protein HMPREF2967_11085 [Corynebacterium sp. HMSC059E07]|nr:hypothetical protein HMPREF2967_11085 [Corynebacterium sp. HMSC059E07]